MICGKKNVEFCRGRRRRLGLGVIVEEVNGMRRIYIIIIQYCGI